MPPRVRPRDVWQVDWADNGFKHPHADVSGDVWSALVRWGAATEADAETIRLTGAQGTLRVENRGNRYDPLSSNTDLTEAQLRNPHRARLTSVVDRPVAGPWAGTVTAYLDGDGQPVPSHAYITPAVSGWPPVMTGGIPAGVFALPGSTAYWGIRGNFEWQGVDPDVEGVIPYGLCFQLQSTTPNAAVPSPPPGYGWRIRNLTGGYDVWIPWRLPPGYSPPRAGVTMPEQRQFTRLAHPFAADVSLNRWLAYAADYLPSVGDRVEITLVEWVQVEWEGVAINTLGSQLSRTTYADFRLLSKGYKVYDQVKAPFEETQPQPFSKSVYGSGGELVVASFLDKHLPPDLYDPQLTSVNDDGNPLKSARQPLQVGVVQFPSQVLDRENRNTSAGGQTELGFLNACARYALGWAVENRQGNIGIVSWSRAAHPTAGGTVLGFPGLSFDDSYKPRRSDAWVELRSGYVRNWMRAEARTLQAGATETLSSQTVDTAELARPAARRRWWPPTEADRAAVAPHGVVFPPDSSARADKAVVFDPQGGPLQPGDATLTFTYTFDYTGVNVDISPVAGNNRKFTMKIQGKKRSIQPAGRETYTNAESVALYGHRDYVLPPWFTPAGLNSEWLTAFINRMAAPIRYFRLSFPRTHADRGKLADLAAVDAGQVIRITFTDADGRTWTEACLVVGCRLEDNAPDQTKIKTLYGLTLEHPPN